MKHFSWLKSIRIQTSNGYMNDEDCNRIEEYFLKEMQKAMEVAWKQSMKPKHTPNQSR